jgi:hypothetical protein
VPTKKDGSANIQNTLVPRRKMVISTVKYGLLHYFFSPILFLTLLDITFQWGLLLLVAFVIDHLTTAGDHHGDFNDFVDDGNLNFQNSTVQNHKKESSVVFHPPWESHLSCCHAPCMPFPCIPMLLVYSNTLRKSIRKKDY